MAGVVIIGGGLGGLGAAWRLENLFPKDKLSYTIIDYRPRLGGSLASGQEAGFVYDFGRMLTPDSPLDSPMLLSLLGDDAFLPARTDEDGVWSALRGGHQALIDVLTRQLRAQVLTRMAVTSVGMFDSAARAKGAPRFCVCLENGTVLEASALIVAVPAVHAARMFRSLSQTAAMLLDNARYDHIARLNLGYRAEDVAGKLPDVPPREYPLTYLYRLDAPARVPSGGVLVQAGVRYDPTVGIAPHSNGDLTGEFAALFGLPETPLFEKITLWDYDEPLMWLEEDFEARMARLRYALPDGVAVAGSDYVMPSGARLSLEERFLSGVRAVDLALTTGGLT
jgi:predicted NAD/FAD-dependent oxidoreductase